MSEFPLLEMSSAMPVKTTYLNLLKPLKTVYFIKNKKKKIHLEVGDSFSGREETLQFMPR